MKYTKEQYDNACSNINFIRDCIGREHSRIDGLLGQLVECKQNIDQYRECLEQNKEIKMWYETYMEAGAAE